MKKLYLIYTIINLICLGVFGYIIFKDNKSNLITVEIKGYVLYPGIYSLEEDKRISDLIALSGGLLKESSIETINLSKKLTDEMVVIIYSNSEIEQLRKGITSVKYIEKECICPKISNDACIDTFYDNSSIINDTGKISINTASLEELMTIPKIGETKAKAIIEYRTITPFKSIEEIMNIKGIGEATFESIKGYLML